MKCAHNARYNKPEWIGKKFCRLTVEGCHLVKTPKGKQWYWDCVCDCGNKVSVVPGNVVAGHTTSCGCSREEKRKMINTKHGESHTRLYIIWQRMNGRCDLNRANKIAYARRYSLRGIRVCDEWKNYEAFATWARANGYNDNLSIERIDNDGNYCPENCTWIERGKQARNRGTTFHVIYNGRDMSLAEACEIANMPYKQVFARIKYMGWSVDEALNIPMRSGKIHAHS